MGKMCTIAHSLMVHVRVSEAYIQFSLMHTTDHIFLVLPIKDLINKDGDPATLYKLATGTKPSVSYLRVLFCPCVVRKATAHVGTKSLNMCHQAQTLFLLYLCWDSTASKRISCVRTKYKENNIFI